MHLLFSTGVEPACREDVLLADTCSWHTWQGLARNVGSDQRRRPLLVQARQLEQRQRLVAKPNVHCLRARLNRLHLCMSAPCYGAFVALNTKWRQC